MIFAIVACIASLSFNGGPVCTATVDKQNDYADETACQMQFEDNLMETMMYPKDDDKHTVHYAVVCIPKPNVKDKDLEKYLIMVYGDHLRERA